MALEITEGKLSAKVRVLENHESGLSGTNLPLQLHLAVLKVDKKHCEALESDYKKFLTDSKVKPPNPEPGPDL